MNARSASRRLGAGHAVQVDLGIDRELAPAQADQHGSGTCGRRKLSSSPVLQQRLVRRRQQAFPQHFDLVGAREAGLRRAVSARRGGWRPCAAAGARRASLRENCALRRRRRGSRNDSCVRCERGWFTV